jgi:hypothetical protein
MGDAVNGDGRPQEPGASGKSGPRARKRQFSALKTAPGVRLLPGVGPAKSTRRQRTAAPPHLPARAGPRGRKPAQPADPGHRAPATPAGRQPAAAPFSRHTASPGAPAAFADAASLAADPGPPWRYGWPGPPRRDALWAHGAAFVGATVLLIIFAVCLVSNPRLVTTAPNPLGPIDFKRATGNPLLRWRTRRDPARAFPRHRRRSPHPSKKEENASIPPSPPATAATSTLSSKTCPANQRATFSGRHTSVRRPDAEIHNGLTSKA